MVDFNPELKRKLSLLKIKQRQAQNRYFWRSIIVSLVAGGIFSLAIFPHWQIKTQSQIKIEGDRYILSSAIYQALNFNYPQSAIAVPTQKIENRLGAMPIIKSVRVTKTILPPAVKIALEERIPVATAVSSGQVGFLDDKGVWLDPNFYDLKNNNLNLSDLKIVNFQPQYSQAWAKIYDLIIAYPTIGIREIHWDDVGNLFFVTENFKVFLGTNSSLLKKQFIALASFPNLATNKELQPISQIDLTNPDVPTIDKH